MRMPGPRGDPSLKSISPAFLKGREGVKCGPPDNRHGRGFTIRHSGGRAEASLIHNRGDAKR